MISGFFATTSRVSISGGFRLYRHVSKSVHVAFFVVSMFMLSMINIIFFHIKGYCSFLSIPQNIFDGCNRLLITKKEGHKPIVLCIKWLSTKRCIDGLSAVKL